MNDPRQITLVETEAGEITLKRCWRYRCENYPNGTRCRRRRSFPQPLEWYSPGRAPKCPSCGSRKRWHHDKYRDTVELDAQLCRCSGAPYPHRIGTAATGGRFGRWECERHVPF